MKNSHRYQKRELDFSSWIEEATDLKSLKGIPKPGKETWLLEKLSGDSEPERCSRQSLASSFRAKINGGKRVGQDVWEVSLDISGMDWPYKVGDSFGVLCSNPDEIVLPLLARLGLDGQQLYRFSKDSPRGVPGVVTARESLACYLDLHTMPKK
ncbi:hypothetical protein HDU91_003284, partial [Kappamyces sp. JEL0680]